MNGLEGSYYSLTQKIILCAATDFQKGLKDIPRLQNKILETEDDGERRRQMNELVAVKRNYRSAVKFFKSDWFETLADELELSPDVIRGKIKQAEK